jgi:hypothetical protein
MTRTHTVYFGDEQLQRLKRELKKLEADFESRGLYVGDQAKAAGRRRLLVLRAAIESLSEPVPESYT